METKEVKLWHDDIRRPPDSSWVWARTNGQAKDILTRYNVVEASLDHDLGLHDYDPDEEDADLRRAPEFWLYETGYDLVKWMVHENHLPKKATIHSWNPGGAKWMAGLLQQYGVCVTVKPYARG